MRDFSYLDTTSRKRTILLMCMGFGLGIAILLGTWGFNNMTEIEREYMTDRQLAMLSLAYTGGLIMALIGIVFLIHYAGGIKPKDVFAYQLWC